MKFKSILYALALLTTLLIPTPSWAWDLSSLQGIDTDYSKALHSLALEGADSYLPLSNPDLDGIALICFSHPANDLYMGVGQFMKINAPLERVTQFLERFEDYPKWTDGLLSNSAQKLKDGKFLVSSEQHVPIPFVSNVHSRMIYSVEKKDNKVFFRYQLKSSNSLTAYDGFILLEENKDRTTQYIEYDFWDADWGLGKSFAKDRIWADSLQGIYQWDIAFKLRSENLNITDHEVLDVSKKKAKIKSLEPCLTNKVSFKYLAK